MKRLPALAWLMAVSLFLAACNGASIGGSEPVLVAAQPQTAPPAAGADQVNPPPGDWQVISTAYLELEVTGLDRAARLAIETVGEYGGYLVNSYTWSDSTGDEVTSLTLALPAGELEPALRSLRRLGAVIDERRSEIVDRGGYGPLYALVTLQLRPVQPPSRLSLTPDDGWSPGRTFRRAFAVFTAIFQFLADIVIWVAVVAGPFILAGLVAWHLLRRRRSPQPPDEAD